MSPVLPSPVNEVWEAGLGGMFIGDVGRDGRRVGTLPVELPDGLTGNAGETQGSLILGAVIWGEG